MDAGSEFGRLPARIRHRAAPGSPILPEPLKVLAVASGGGHWVQLLRVMPAFENADVVYVTVDRAYLQALPDARYHIVSDATRWSRWSMVKTALGIAWILLLERPDVIFTTGALPGGFAVILGRIIGRRTIWLDSIANVEEMSMTGRMVRRFATLWLTQWPDLAAEEGPEYAGAVL